MAASPASVKAPVLVVGGTGDLGGRVVDALLARKKKVRALVRPASDASTLQSKGVQIVRGDLLDRASLDAAVKGVDAIVTSAAGYTGHTKGDTLQTDDVGNRNLVDAAKAAQVRVFVFTSILECEKAQDVPHFWQKKLIEDYLETSQVPFVALRPGAFLGGTGGGWLAGGLKKGKLMQLGTGTVRWSYIHPDDVARCLADAVDLPRAIGRRIDLGSDRPVSQKDLADLFSKLLGREISLDARSGKMMGLMFGLGGLFSARMKDMKKMFDFFETGKYVANTKPQMDLFGAVPTIESAAKRLAQEQGLLPANA